MATVTLGTFTFSQPLVLRAVAKYLDKDALKEWSTVTARSKLMHFPWRDYHEDGQLNDQGTYLNGRLDGEYKAWYKHCRLLRWMPHQLRERSMYRDGKLDGERELYLYLPPGWETMGGTARYLELLRIEELFDFGF